MRERILTCLQGDGHTGIVKMRKRAQQIVFWLGINADIRAFVDRCGPCWILQAAQPATPLTAEGASAPMSSLGCDLYQWGDRDYMVLVDRYSG